MQHAEQKIKFANNIESCTSEPATQSPVRAQMKTIQQQLTQMENAIDKLIDATRDVLAADPRQQPICEHEINPVSCALEGGLADISRRLDDQINMLAAVNRSVQL